MSQPTIPQTPGTEGRPDVRGHHLESIIGQGGSSTVWRGADAGGHPVAVKVPHERPDPVALEQATIERHVLMAVEHEHLVGLRDVVPMNDGRVALVFDLVSGALLTGLVRRRGHLRTGEVVTVLTPLCAAVRALHLAGGTHGDISPSNVMVTEAGVPLLLDLGASRVIAAAPGARFGTPGFIAPEVRRGAPADARSDVFSLGALAWFCATGNGAPDTDQRLDSDTVRSHVGDELAAVVAACIDPDPDRRPAGDQLARLFYDVTRAEAVEVVLGADDAAALTHRLREQAAGEQSEPHVVSRWRGLRARLRRRTDADEHRASSPVSQPAPLTPMSPTAATRTTRHAGSGVPGRMRDMLRNAGPGAGAADGRRVVAGAPETEAKGQSGPGRSEFASAGSRRSRPMLMALAAGAAVIAGVAVSGAVASTMSTSAGADATTLTRQAPANPPLTPAPSTVSPAQKSTSGSSSRGAVKPAPGSKRSSQNDARSNRQAPTSQTIDLVNELSRYRAEALMRRDSSLLAQVHAARSAARKADVALIATLVMQDLTWQSLRPSVTSARLVEQEGRRAVIRARVRWAAYDVVTATGVRSARAADPSSPLDLTVVWGNDGWRLSAVSDPPAR